MEPSGMAIRVNKLVMPWEAIMKFEHKEVIDGRTVITTSKRFLFWHITTQYEAQKEYPTGYWEWLRLPNRNLVPDSVSFQLDAWNRL